MSRIFLPRWNAAIKPHDHYVDWSIVSSNFPAEPGTAVYRLDEIGVIQPVLVAIAIAYADLLVLSVSSRAAVVGHSMGEVAAACIAGVLDLDQAMHMICRRSALMQRTAAKVRWHLLISRRTRPWPVWLGVKTVFR